MIKWLINLMITSMIFFPDKTLDDHPKNYRLIYEDAWVTTADGVKLHGWYLKAPQEKGGMLFFHGNAGNISHRLFKAKPWVERGISVFLVDYRGYGQSEGEMKHGEDLVADARAAFKWLTEIKKIPLSKIILAGESLGTHPAIRLAVEHKAGALLLEAPFTSFFDLARTHYPFIPPGLVKDFSFPNIDYIQDVKMPVYFLHGTADEICPYALGTQVFEKAPEPKERFTIPGGGHNDLPSMGGEDYWQRPYEFILEYLA